MSIKSDNEYMTTCIVQYDSYYIGCDSISKADIYGYRMAMHSSVIGDGFSDIEKFELKRKYHV